MAKDERKTPQLTPLWVVALFVTFTETVLGVAVTQTDGGIQVCLTVFVLVFPTLVAIAFFRVLWYRPWVLYSPGEYKTTKVKDYIEAMQRDISDLRKDQSRLWGLIGRTRRFLREGYSTPGFTEPSREWGSLRSVLSYLLSVFLLLLAVSIVYGVARLFQYLVDEKISYDWTQLGVFGVIAFSLLAIFGSFWSFSR